MHTSHAIYNKCIGAEAVFAYTVYTAVGRSHAGHLMPFLFYSSAQDNALRAWQIGGETLLR